MQRWGSDQSAIDLSQDNAILISDGNKNEAVRVWKYSVFNGSYFYLPAWQLFSLKNIFQVH